MLRYLLVVLGLLGCCLDYMLRFNISVAIVSMVNTTHTQDVNTTSYKCPAAINASSAAQKTTGGGEYDWTDREQGLVLGVFFWGYLVTKTIGGRIAELVGPHLTVTVSISLCGVLTLLTPTVADLSPYALAALRLLMGVLQGPIFPALYCIISRWAPAGEVATMIAATYSGMGIGALLSLGFSAMVVQAVGWRWVFWGGGIVTLVWVPFWVIYVKDSPAQHPGISRRELSLLSENHNEPRKRVPWSRIFASRHVYLFALMEFIGVWAQGILITEGPTFLTTQLGLHLDVAGMVGLVLTGCAFVMSLVYGWLSDLIKRREWLRTVNIRRLMQGIGLTVTTVGTVGILLAPCDAPLVSASLVMMSMAIPVSVATYTLGPMDIAPNYAGTMSGIYGVGNIAGFLSPMFVSYFISKENGWTIIYLTNMGLYATGSLLYIIGVSASEAEWNLYEEIPGDNHSTPEKKRLNGKAM